MDRKKIKFPAPVAVGSNKEGPVFWNVPEYLLNVVFIQDALYSSKEDCEMIAYLHPVLTPLKNSPEGTELIVDNEVQAWLIKKAVPSTHNTLTPEAQHLVATSRVAIHCAETVKATN